jgi:uncharacterized membrane protein YkvA (DUF1232 family)
MPSHDSISDQDFLGKIRKVPLQAGCAVLRAAVTLYVLLRDDDVPIWAKASIVAALGYFISPIDALPDFLPGGYGDDLAVMTLLLGQLDVFLDADGRKRVEELLPVSCRNRIF